MRSPVTRICSLKEIRNQVEINAQITSQLQADEQARRQQQHSQTHDMTGRDCPYQQSHIPHQQNRQDFPET